MSGDGVAFVTMVRDEPVFLPIWLGYYERLVPRAHLFVVLDGLDLPVPAGLDGVQLLRVPKGRIGAGWDEARWRMLSALTSSLCERFDVVVTNDVDELILHDPAMGGSLMTDLLAASDLGVISPFAFEIVHRPDIEPAPLDLNRPLLRQRSHGRINAAYCKPCITSRSLRWSIGGHHSDFPVLNLSRSLYLFHLRAMDSDLLRQRQMQRRDMVADSEGRLRPGIAGGGWSRGQKKRSRASWLTS